MAAWIDFNMLYFLFCFYYKILKRPQKVWLQYKLFYESFSWNNKKGLKYWKVCSDERIDGKVLWCESFT